MLRVREQVDRWGRLDDSTVDDDHHSVSDLTHDIEVVRTKNARDALTLAAGQDNWSCREVLLGQADLLEQRNELGPKFGGTAHASARNRVGEGRPNGQFASGG